mgnify:CR=1 FL=1
MTDEKKILEYTKKHYKVENKLIEKSKHYISLLKANGYTVHEIPKGCLVTVRYSGESLIPKQVSIGSREELEVFATTKLDNEIIY